MQSKRKSRSGSLSLIKAAEPRRGAGWLDRLRLWKDRTPQAEQTTAREEVFERLAVLGQQVAAEGQRVLTASMEIARESKMNSDQLRASLPLIEEVREIAADATALCAKSQTQVVSSRRLMEECVTLSHQRSALIADLVTSVKRSHSAFREVNGNVTEVERFLEVIQEIGAQTNLLALNAAIEAARAGTHGSGFLVVAREMRLLADKTQVATEQIRQITDRVQTATRSGGSVLDAALRASSVSEDQGRRVSEAVQGTQPPMLEAEANLVRVAEAASRQLQSLQQLEDQWHCMRDGVARSTHNADASAEMSMQTISLAVRFYTELAHMAEAIQSGTIDQAASAAWRHRVSGLTQEAARCATASGIARLDELRPQLTAGLRDLKLECTSRGLCSRRGRVHAGDTLPELCIGGRAVNGSFEVVDMVLRRTGLNATLFVLAQEENDGARVFYRVSTTVKRSDGSRAVKSSLNPRASVADKLLAGESVYGYAYILGAPHIAAYEPIKDAVGEVIGALYVGLAARDQATGAARQAAA